MIVISITTFTIITFRSVFCFLFTHPRLVFLSIEMPFFASPPRPALISSPTPNGSCTRRARRCGTTRRCSCRSCLPDRRASSRPAPRSRRPTRARTSASRPPSRDCSRSPRRDTPCLPRPKSSSSSRRRSHLHLPGLPLLLQRQEQVPSTRAIPPRPLRPQSAATRPSTSGGRTRLPRVAWTAPRRFPKARPMR